MTASAFVLGLAVAEAHQIANPASTFCASIKGASVVADHSDPHKLYCQLEKSDGGTVKAEEWEFFHAFNKK